VTQKFMRQEIHGSVRITGRKTIFIHTEEYCTNIVV